MPGFHGYRHGTFDTYQLVANEIRLVRVAWDRSHQHGGLASERCLPRAWGRNLRSLGIGSTDHWNEKAWDGCLREHFLALLAAFASRASELHAEILWEIHPLVAVYLYNGLLVSHVWELAELDLVSVVVCYSEYTRGLVDDEHHVGDLYDLAFVHALLQTQWFD